MMIPHLTVTRLVLAAGYWLQKDQDIGCKLGVMRVISLAVREPWPFDYHMAVLAVACLSNH
jgi:hypothetical protein